MKSLMKTPVGRLRLIARWEAISFLALLGIAMPLKYLGGVDVAVKWTGWIHGILFVIFCIALALAMRAARWSILKAGIVFIAALVPFGPFLIDHRLRDADPERPD